MAFLLQVNGPGGQPVLNFANQGDESKWAHDEAPNRKVRILMGVPGGQSADGGYVPALQLGSIIDFSKNFSSFGGVMIWDASQAWRNDGFL